jgi:formylglycine-generating enzyme required for sulfatase activity
MVYIPAGRFMMGSEEGDKDERPRQEVHVDAFYIDRAEVTNAQYKKFVDATGHRTPKAALGVHLPYEWVDGRFPRGRGEHPVVLVSWEDAVAYALWAGKRLPTEAEWEKAARGTDGRTYPWGNEWDPSRCNSAAARRRGTMPVGSCPTGASPYGCLDMAGNVQEWCLDIYQKYYYGVMPVFNPQGPEDGVRCVVRDGSWAHRDVRSANRAHIIPPHRLTTLGFRCALSASPEPAGPGTETTGKGDRR